jgi:hypothetical protein
LSADEAYSLEYGNTASGGRIVAPNQPGKQHPRFNRDQTDAHTVSKLAS